MHGAVVLAALLLAGTSIATRIVTLESESNMNFPNVQLASTTVVDGIYYAISDMTNSIIAVNPHNLSIIWDVTVPQMYTGYTMGGAARLMVAGEYVIVSTRVIDGMSQYGWTGAYHRTDGSFAWNISNIACVGDVPTFHVTQATATSTLSFWAANYSGNYQDVFVSVHLATGDIVKTIALGGGSVLFIQESEAAAVFVNEPYSQKYLELLDLKTMRPIWRVASASAEQFLGFQNLITATSAFVVVSNSTSSGAVNVSLLLLSTPSSDGALVHVISDVPYSLNSNVVPSLDLTTSPSSALLTYWSTGTNTYVETFVGLSKDGTWTELWSTSVNASAVSVVVFGGDTIATLTLTGPANQTLDIHNFTSGFKATIPNLKRDNMSSWAQLWVYTHNVVMLPYSVDTPTWSSGFVLYNATDGAFLGDTQFSQITYDTLWSNTPTYALEYAPGQYLIDNTQTLYRQTFE